MAPVKDSAVDYSHLSDEELGQMLTDYGVSIGPINDATRTTYERRLNKLQTGQESPPTQHFEAAEEDDDEDDEVQLHVPQQKPSPRPAVVSHPEPSHPEPLHYLLQPRMRREVQDTSSYSQRIEARANLNAPRKTTSLYSESSESRLSSRPAQKTAPPPSQSKGIPLWVKLVSVLVIAVLVYLIYSNMEPQAVSSIPGVSHKVEV